MRYLLLTLIAAISIPTAVQANWLGKYGSQFEADEACKNWKKKGKKFFQEYKIETYNSNTYLFDEEWKSREYNSRRCVLERSTNQYLGFEYNGVKESATYRFHPSVKFNEKVKKYFKF